MSWARYHLFPVGDVPKGQARVQEKTDDTLLLRAEERLKSQGYFQEMLWKTGSLMPWQVLWIMSQGERKT